MVPPGPWSMDIDLVLVPCPWSVDVDLVLVLVTGSFVSYRADRPPFSGLLGFTLVYPYGPVGPWTPPCVAAKTTLKIYLTK